jgi:hypothetical protein
VAVSSGPCGVEREREENEQEGSSTLEPEPCHRAPQNGPGGTPGRPLEICFDGLEGHLVEFGFEWRVEKIVGPVTVCVFVCLMDACVRVCGSRHATFTFV